MIQPSLFLISKNNIQVKRKQYTYLAALCGGEHGTYEAIEWVKRTFEPPSLYVDTDTYIVKYIHNDRIPMPYPKLYKVNNTYEDREAAWDMYTLREYRAQPLSERTRTSIICVEAIATEPNYVFLYFYYLFVNFIVLSRHNLSHSNLLLYIAH